MKIFQKGFNYSQDGPGNRLVYHLQGCNFRCPWCSNPEGMGVVCGKTVDMTVDEMYAELLRSRPMFFDGGGVTFTGGEATLQMDELMPLCRRLKSAGINTCIETNGSHSRLPRLWAFIDHVIMDLKHFDAHRHAALTGVDGELVYRNLQRLCDEGKPALIRIPLIGGLNTDPAGFLAFLSRYDCRALTFELLPYHEYGRDKWTTEYTVRNGFVPEELLRDFADRFTAAGLTLTHT